MIAAHETARRAMRRALDEAIDELDAALDDPDDNRLAEAVRRVSSLEKQVAAMEGGIAP